MESPYRPPQVTEPDQTYSTPLGPGEFRFSPDVQRMLGRLSKYLRDIGGLLMFLAVLAGLGFVFSAIGPFIGSLPGGPGSSPEMMIQLLQQLINVVFLFVIGRLMRQAGRPFQATAESPDGHITHLMNAMNSLKSLYGTQIVFMGLGIIFMLLLLVV